MKIWEESKGFETGSSSRSIFSGDWSSALENDGETNLESLCIETLEGPLFLENLGTLGFFLSCGEMY